MTMREGNEVYGYGNLKTMSLVKNEGNNYIPISQATEALCMSQKPGEWSNSICTAKDYNSESLPLELRFADDNVQIACGPRLK